MLSFIQDNLGTIIVGAILLVTVLIIIAKLMQRKKAGKCVACNYCDKCPSSRCSSSSSNCPSNKSEQKDTRTE